MSDNVAPVENVPTKKTPPKKTHIKKTPHKGIAEMRAELKALEEKEKEKKQAEKMKRRSGKDLVFIFYALMLLIVLIATFQVAGYAIGMYGQHTFLYGVFAPLFKVLGLDILNPSFRLQLFSIPLEPLILFATAYTSMYGGFEGTNSLVASLKLPAGSSKPMPEYKIKRFFNFIIVWIVLSFLLVTYQTVINNDDTKTVSFCLDKVLFGLGTTCLGYLYARQAPKVVENVGPKSV